MKYVKDNVITFLLVVAGVVIGMFIVLTLLDVFL